ncbi:MAG: LPS export ABC transporter periplasmic protein LptC [Lonepinella koalarum]|nr:LPS export ABC transporter periplasmic protein LptC [Lonepinella koalarum]
MNIRWTVILSVIALCLLTWFYTLNQKDEDLSSLIKKDEQPEYVGHNMQTLVYSPTGQKQYQATAKQVEYFQQDGRTHFILPDVLLFEITSEKSQQKHSWTLRADKAVLTKDNMLYLSGNVIAQSLVNDSKLQRVETQQATVNLKTQDITSDQAVKINGLNFTSTGLKLVGNLQQQTATLKEQVKTYYEIQK